MVPVTHTKVVLGKWTVKRDGIPHLGIVPAWCTWPGPYLAFCGYSHCNASAYCSNCVGSS